ncbi:helix-turn-helix transcriptional regulator [Algoriphagus taiwanensis]
MLDLFEKIMNTLERLYLLDECLGRTSFRVRYDSFKNYLEEKFDVVRYGKRTFHRDIQEIKNKIEIEFPTLFDQHGQILLYDKKKDEYRYALEDFSINQRLTNSELNLVARKLSYNRHLFEDGKHESLVNKLRSIALTLELESEHEPLPWNPIELIGSRSGSQNLDLILNSIYRKTPIRVFRERFGKKGNTYDLLPLMVKEYNNGWYTGWYLLGFPVNESQQKIKLDIKPLRLLALDGIKEVVPLNVKLKIDVPRGFNPSDYFRNSMGIIRSNLKGELKPEAVILETIEGSWIYDYIKEYPIHKSQLILLDDTQKRKLKFKIEVEVDDDLKRFLMKYSDVVKAI